jgi:ubiquinone/menaquinone biosynthesis C-methylase UbiE
MSGWLDYWRNQHKVDALNPQLSVARTRNKRVISSKEWQITLDSLQKIIPNRSLGNTLDLCGGNGMFLPLLSKKSSKVTIVDVNLELLQQVDKSDNTMVKTVHSDALKFLSKNSEKFDLIFCYAGIQYFDEREVVELFKLMYRHLNSGGMLFVGDIPDLDKRSKFLVKSNKIDDYYKSLTSDLPIIGHWFAKDWIFLLSKWAGFTEVKILKQKKKLIYSDFRFDLMAEKP